jgi:His/Glu/Gln/Arg/opine family amino acid ABC transporter permease subunit
MKLIIKLTIFCFIFAIKSYGEDKLIIGTSLDYPPFEFVQNGKPAGYEIDIGTIVAEKLGKEAEFIDMDFSALIPALQSGKIDMAISALSATDERKKVLDFTSEHYTDNAGLIVRKSDNIKNEDNLNNKIIGVQLGSVSEKLARKHQDKWDIKKIFAAAKLMQLVEELKLGRIDAILNDYLSSKQFVTMNDNLELIKLQYSMEGGYAIAFKHNSPYLLATENALNEIKANGQIEQLKEKWFADNANIKHGFDWAKYMPFILSGLGLTLLFSLNVIIFGLFGGLIMAFMYNSPYKTIRCFAKFYVSIFRGTPLLVQLSIIYFGIPSLTDISIPAYVAGVITFSLNSTAYVSQIILAGIRSVDKGQFEAAKSLGIPKIIMYKNIILPQAIKNILPSLVNEAVDLIKESSIIAIIGVGDLMRRAQMVSAETYSYFEPLIIAAIYYYIIVYLLSYLAKLLDKKLHHYA